MIAFTIPGDAVPFARCGANGKRRFTPAKQRSFMNLVKAEAASAMHRAGMTPIDDAIRLTIRADYLVPASWSKKRQSEAVWKSTKPDCSNIAKIVEDAMNSIVYRDDAQIAELIIQKRYAAIARVVVTVEALGGR